MASFAPSWLRLLCDGRQIWQRIAASSCWGTCAGIADIKSGNVLWMVERTAGGNLGFAGRLCTKGLIKLIASFFWKNRRFKLFWGLCAEYRI